jgi:RNase H-like domain found in reverse transcriptase
MTQLVICDYEDFGDDVDFQAQKFTLEYEMEREAMEQIMSRRRWDRWVRTMYKRKGKKVHPANVPLPDGIKPEGGFDGGSVSSEGLTVVPRGSRLTPDRLAKMQIGNGFLTKEERQLFVDILFEFEGAIAFEDSEMGMLREEVEPPVKIHTIPHEPWQQQNLCLLKAMQETATAIVKEKLELGVLEHCQGPYRSRYFLVQKKSGSWRFINDVQPLNGVTIKESGMPLAVDEFLEDFAGYPISSAMDYYSGYYEIGLDPASRDLTAFMVPDVGLVRMTRLPQGWTNSVSCFQRIMGKVHWALIPDKCRPFIDDVGLKGPKNRYGDVECEPGIRKFVWEHAQIFRQFMESTWRAGLTISGLKSMIGMPGITIVGFMCDEDGRRPVPKKVQRILDWPTPRSLRETRAFVRTAVYYRIFIAVFALITAPLFQLFKKGKVFKWSDKCAAAMLQLKMALVKAPVLIVLDFSEGALRIELGIDASTKIGWGAVLSQYKDDGKLHPARYESGVWSNPEKKYDALKLECRGLIKALKKLRFWLFGRFFTVVTDSQTLVWLLNQPPNDLPNAMMTRWLAYARLFDFDVRHVKGSQNGKGK